jgi:hypothetical protein
VLLVPDLLADGDQSGLLADALSGGSARAGLPRVEPITAPGIGAVCCAYRTERWGEAGLDGSSGEAILDEHGRPLEIQYGILCATGSVLDVDPTDLEDSRAQALATYRRFLADEGGFVPERSRSFALRSMLTPGANSTAAPGAAQLPEEAGPELRDTAPRESLPLPTGKGVAIAVLAVLVVAAAATLWALLLRSSHGRVVEVQVNAPQVAAAECGRSAAIRFDAVLRTDGKARVAFHWEDRRDAWTSRGNAVSFLRGGLRKIHVSRQVDVRAGEPLSGSMSLVVDQPNRASASRQYTLTCGQP